MIVPPYLKPGDKIRIVSPAGKVQEKYVLPAMEWLLDQGYRVELGEHVFSGHFQYAGTDTQRLNDLQNAFDDPETSAILCARGGYGTVRIAARLNYDGLFRHPKWIVGFSDITVLHNCLSRNRMATIHGAMPRYFFDEDGGVSENLRTLIQVLTGEEVSYSIPPAKYDKPGISIAELTGGNLSIITSLQGTSFELHSEEKILFLEDIDEFYYRADRMVLQLKLGGKLENLAGLVVGDFTNMKDNELPFGNTIHEIIAGAVEEYNYPVCYGFPAGHKVKNLALVFGRTWQLDVNAGGSALKLLPGTII